MKKRTNHRAGLLAEHLALAWLMLKGYMPVATRYRCKGGEIDLIVKRRRTLVFVEVKARRERDTAAHSIHARNQSRVVAAAQYFLNAHPHYADYTVRFDAVLIAWYKRPYHLADAFQHS